MKDDIQKKCKELFDQLMDNKITLEDFTKQVKDLEKPIEANWNEAEG